MARIAKMILVSFVFVFSSMVGAEPTAFQKIDDLISNNKIADAKAAAEAELAKDAKSSELLVRKSRIISLMGDASSNKDEKVKLFDEAQKIASMVIENDPKFAGGYLRRAVAAGKLALYKGILESRVLVLAIKKDASKALELKGASQYQKALANYLLGRVHLKVAEKPKALRMPIGLGWASKKKGREHVKKAAELAPDSIPFNLHHAKVMIGIDNKAAAKRTLSKIKDMKVSDPNDPALQKEAADLLKTL